MGNRPDSMLDQRRSFSFSSFDFNSSNNSSSLFSSSSDEFFSSNFVMYDTEDDDEAYIEINLNPPRPTTKTMLKEKECNNSNSSQVELRISFSSSTGISPIETTTTTTTCGTTQHAPGATMTKPRGGRLFVSLSRIVNEFIGASSANTLNSVRAIEANNVAREHGPAQLLPLPLSKSDCTEMIRNR